MPANGLLWKHLLGSLLSAPVQWTFCHHLLLVLHYFLARSCILLPLSRTRSQKRIVARTLVPCNVENSVVVYHVLSWHVVMFSEQQQSQQG